MQTVSGMCRALRRAIATAAWAVTLIGVSGDDTVAVENQPGAVGNARDVDAAL